MSKEIDFFMDGLQKLIAIHILENDLTLAAAVGCLEIQKQVMISEALESVDDE